jgi:hypothetical protein
MQDDLSGCAVRKEATVQPRGHQAGVATVQRRLPAVPVIILCLCCNTPL